MRKRRNRKIKKDIKNNSQTCLYDVVEIYVLQVHVVAAVVPEEKTEAQGLIL